MTSVPDQNRNNGPQQPAKKEEAIELDLPPRPIAPERTASGEPGDDERARVPPSKPPGRVSGLGRDRPPKRDDSLGGKIARAIAVFARLLVQLSRFGFSKAKQHGGKAISDFNERPEAIRWRAYAFGSYGAMVALTFAFQLWEPNSLAAYVKVQHVAVPEQTVVFVRNDSKKTWKDVKLLLNGQYGYERNELTPGSHVQLPVERFAIYDANGKASYAPKDLPLRTMVIECDRGHFEQEITR